MKKQHILVAGSVLISALALQSCETDIPQGVFYEAYTYASTDEDGGTWNPILLTSGTDVLIDAPSDATSAEYLAELASTKTSASSISTEQQEALDYWGNNTMVRWIEIAEELTAKYFLPPDPGPEGNYPPPTAATATDPASADFPFAHPPFASRMYAYFSAATFDAMIAAWHYKYTYNRPAIFQTDGSVAQAFPTNNIPSYPNEDAAIATVAEKILGFLFPNETAYLAEMADECRESRKWAGLAVESDITAGDSIGSYVANTFIARAKTDNSKFAAVDAATYALLEDTADMMWGDQWDHWENQDIPQRPVGITPRFGNVIPWWIPDVETVRPGPPPAVGSAEFETATQELLDLTDNASKEQEDIAYFWSDGPGTYSPPGHWNQIAIDHVVDGKLNPLRTARVFAYMNTAMNDAGISCWDTKYYYFYPRPTNTNSDIDALFGVPNFPSYTSGHSTFSGAGAEVLGYFFPSAAGEFAAMAVEASESRIYARIHFR
ncbi:MAG: phosphatase PAP2 family protein, partial [Chitinophagales bacterium]